MVTLLSRSASALGPRRIDCDCAKNPSVRLCLLTVARQCCIYNLMSNEPTRFELKPEALRIADSCLAYRTRKLGRAITRIYNDALRPVGVNIAEMNLLVAIGALGDVQPGRLGEAMEMEKSTLSRNIRRLADRGWLVVRDNPDDRGELVSVSRAGSEVVERAAPAWEQAQQKASRLIGDLDIPTISVEG